jgi:hypothetical protein
VVFSTFALNILSNTTRSARAAQSYASLTRRAVLLRTTLASRANVSTASITAIWAASAMVVASHAWVTFASSAGTSMLALDKSC